MMLQRSTRLSCIDSYSAPEVILGLESFAKADMWSVGCILYEIITDDVLFEGESSWERIYLVYFFLGNEYTYNIGMKILALRVDEKNSWQREEHQS